MTRPDDTPSDAQLTADQRQQVDAQYDRDRAADAAEDRLTAAQPIADDPAAGTGPGDD